MSAEVMVLQAGAPFAGDRAASLLIDALELELAPAERSELIAGLTPRLDGVRDVRTGLQRLRQWLAGPRLKVRRDLELLAAAARLEATVARRRQATREAGPGLDGGPTDIARPLTSLERPLAGSAPRWIDRTTPIVSIGTCFSTALSHALQHRQFNYRITESFRLAGQEYHHASAGWGNLFSAAAIRQEIRAAFDLAVPPPIVWERHGGRGLVDPWHEEVQFLGAPERSAKDVAHRRAARQAFLEAEVLVITLAQIEVWRLCGTEFVLARRPWGLDDALFELKTHTVADVVSELRQAIATLRSFNPRCRVMLAATPMRLIGAEDPASDPRVASSLALAVNAAAIQEVAALEAGVQVFPYAALIESGGSLSFASDERHIQRPMYARVLGEFLRTAVRRPEEIAVRLAGRESAFAAIPPEVAYTPSAAMSAQALLTGLTAPKLTLVSRAIDRTPVAVLCLGAETMEREIVALRQAGAMVITVGSSEELALEEAINGLKIMQTAFDRWRELAPPEDATEILELELAYERFMATGETTGRARQLLARARERDRFGLESCLRPALARRNPVQAESAFDDAPLRFPLELGPGASETAILMDPARQAAIAAPGPRALARAALGAEPILARVRVLDAQSVRQGHLDDGPFLGSVHILLAPDGREPSALAEGAWPEDLDRALVLTAVADLFGATTARHEPQLLMKDRAQARGFDAALRWWERMRSHAPWNVL